MEDEVGKAFDKQTQYFISQAGAQFCLNGIERERVARSIEKFKTWGYDVVGAFHNPTSIISAVSALPLNWTEPGRSLESSFTIRKNFCSSLAGEWMVWWF
jgi:hypothetical protein